MSNHACVAELAPQLHDAPASSEVTARLRQAESSIGALRALLDALGPALLLVAGDSRPIFSNRRAAQILAQRDGLALGATGLLTDSKRTTRSLRAAIAEAAARANSLHNSSLTLRFSVARCFPRPPWLLSVLPIALDGGLDGSGAGNAAISIVESDVRTRIDPASAADYFLLTPREADVAALLAAGSNSREAARALHIRIGTVRTHLKSLFEKTGARSQTALALKLQAFAVRD